MKLELNDDERAIIEEMLDKEAQSLPIEIHHTTVFEFKEMLKTKKKAVDDLLGKVRSA
ncbi:MAG TPA: hypothetical protein PKM65_10450 [Spirochaetota bacterium]|nr:hypothetical protein [Spirochaetota bacterium]HNT12279.1 hypothetical protein [Spirochaetota bacterium]HNV47228.1 hypothetical protein [Spirochaetota bacterium]HOS38628.1 hypothetical protein [Spirochaetota bacterium]HPI23140.1 hypothetical protein [Spirochaetota bacterium]